MTSWGTGTWDTNGPWGGGSATEGLTLDDARALKENAVRLTFNVAVYFSGLGEPGDSSLASKYSLAPESGTAGLDGEAARPVTPVLIALPTEGIAAVDVGRVVDVYLDRPMTAYPARYDITVTNIFTDDLTIKLASATLGFQSVYRQLAPVTLNSPAHSRDLANPQTLSAAVATNTLLSDGQFQPLGTYAVDASGDYAMDEGREALRKRVLRRLMTRKGGFSHMPEYGIGVLTYGKQLARASALSTLVAEAERQLAREPDIAKVRVAPQRSLTEPGLVRLNVLIQPVAGPAFSLELPVSL